jgi:Protein of unknown function (DUF998)
MCTLQPHGMGPPMDKTNSAGAGRTTSAHREGLHPIQGQIRPSGRTARKSYLVCGILSSLLYVATLVLAPMLWEGYSSTSQTVSELFAIDVPSRPLVVPLMLTYDVLVMVFGFGILGSAGRKRALRVAGGLLVAYGAVGLAGPFAPIHLRAALAAGEGTLTDTMHGIITIVLVLFMMLAIGFGAAAIGRRFRLYSIATILVLLLGGVLTGLDQPRLVANLPTPWMGVWERIDIGVFLLWVVVLAVALLRTQAERPEGNLDGRSHPKGG